MTDDYYAGVYWKGRSESAEECARRAERFFHLLSYCDPLYTRWFEQAKSRKKALQLQFEPTRDTFLRFFSKKKYQSVEGFSFGAWTGHEDQGHGGLATLFCGASDDTLTNSCVLHLPYEEPEMMRVLTPPVLAEVMRAMVLAWEPDWGVVVSGDFRDALRSEDDPRAILGWLTYLSHRRGELPALPGPVRVVPVEDKGSLLLLTPERLSAANPSHLALGRRVQELLDARELLRPELS